MRLLYVARPDVPVPPCGYGGTERILASLIGGAVDNGDAVTLLGHRESTVPCEVLPANEPSGRNAVGRRLSLYRVRRRVMRLAQNADVVHCTAPLHHALPLLSTRKPLVIHFHSAVTEGQKELLRGSLRFPDLVQFITCGRAMLPRDMPSEQQWRAIPNGIPLREYPYVDRADSPPYLAYLGRLTEGKGVDLAIEVAKATGIPLRIAGPRAPLTSRGKYDADYDFQETVIWPAVRQGFANYVGELAHAEKVAHLSGAVGLLHPARTPEPFGLDVAEALACGTPVVALDRGEMPFLVRHGETGFLCSDAPSMAASVRRLGDLDRHACRRFAEGQLDETTMVQSFLTLYDELACLR